MYTLSAIISETTSDCAIRSWIWTQQPFLNCSQAETKRPRTVMGTLSRSSLAPWILKISVVFKDYPGLISLNITGNNLHWIGFEILQESIVRIVFYPDIWGVSCRKHLNKQFQDRRSSFCGVLLVFSNWAAEVVVKLPQNMFVAKTILRPTIYFSIYGWTGSMFNPKAGIHILSHLGFLFISVFPFFQRFQSGNHLSVCLASFLYTWKVYLTHFPQYHESMSSVFLEKTIQDVPDDFPSFRSSWIHHQGAVPSTMPNINASTVAEVLTLEPTCKAAAIKPRGVQKKGGTLFGDFFRRIFFGFLFPICSI